MTFPDLFRLYIWLVDVIRQSNGITLEEINKKWSRTGLCDGRPMSRSSFIRHKDAIADIFGIKISCTRDGGYRYKLEDRDIFNRDNVQNWMISTLSVNNVLTEGLSLNDRIIIEPVASSAWLGEIIKAMKTSTAVTIEYQKYNTSKAKEYRIEPYCLKLFRRRWYVMGVKHGDGEFRTFSLDRIKTLEQTDDRFEISDCFSASEFYRDSYGVMRDTRTEVEHVIIRAYGIEAKQMDDLPIHWSQRKLEGEDEKHTDFELRLRPTADFISHLMSRGSNIKVVEPSWLADQIREFHRRAAEMYDEEDGETAEQI